MADEPLMFEYRISPALGYFLAGGSLYFAFLAIGLALSEPYGFYRWEWVSQATGVLLLGCGSFVLVRRSLRFLLAKRREPRYVELTDDTLKVPEVFISGRITDTLVPLDQVTKMRCSRISDSESLRVWYGKKWAAIPAECLPGPEEFRTLQAALIEQLEARGVPIEQREFRFSRPQFSLRFLLLVTTAAAVLLAITVCVAGAFRIELFVGLLLTTSFWIVAGMVLVYGRWWMRAILVGFVAGFIWEFYAVCRVLDSGTIGVALPGGGPLVYPITSLLWQDALPQGPRFTFSAVMAGPAVSGVLFSLLALAVVAGVRRQLRKCKAARAGART